MGVDGFDGTGVVDGRTGDVGDGGVGLGGDLFVGGDQLGNGGNDPIPAVVLRSDRRDGFDNTGAGN